MQVLKINFLNFFPAGASTTSRCSSMWTRFVQLGASGSMRTRPGRRCFVGVPQISRIIRHRDTLSSNFILAQTWHHTLNHKSYTSTRSRGGIASSIRVRKIQNYLNARSDFFFEIFLSSIFPNLMIKL